MPRQTRTVALAVDGNQRQSISHTAGNQRITIDRFVATAEELAAVLETEDARAVYTYRISDLGERAADVRALIERLLDNDISFTSVVEGITTTEKGQRTLLLHLLAMAVELEHKKLVTNLRKQFALRGRGRRPTGGQRYGQRPFEDEVIAYIVRLRFQGLSHQSITDRLNQEGIPATKAHGTWHRKVVQRLLQRALTSGAEPHAG